MAKEKPLNWASETERQQWLIEQAQYFTVIRRMDYRYHRVEFPTLPEALAMAKLVVGVDPAARLLIYAVNGNSDTYVCTVDNVTENKPPDPAAHV